LDLLWEKDIEIVFAEGGRIEGEAAIAVDEAAEHRAGNDPSFTRIRVRGLGQRGPGATD